MTDQPTPGAEARARLIAAAREATGKLRDAARLCAIIDFRQRDELVVAIHRALDLLAADGEAHDYLQQRCSAHPSDPLELVCVRCFESEKTAAATERAEQAEAKLAEGWRDISVYPKDAEYRLLYSSAHGQVVGAHVTGDVWHLVGVGAITDASSRPTHWMPLPAPPGGTR